MPATTSAPASQPASPFTRPPQHSGPVTALQLIDRIVAKTGAP